MQEATACISCKSFTLKPRSDNGMQSHLSKADRSMLKLGAARCALEPRLATWFGAEAPRQCAQHQAIEPHQVQKRRDYLEFKRNQE